MAPCGFCRGRGRVLNHQADRYGPRPDYPSERPCDYCGGSGQCEDGDQLAPQGKVYQCDDEDRARSGLAPWM